ncbi:MULTISPECIES: hypothetical protein [unclassified Moorena]|uniref:hypothetical protein n=1 Tax=unclassified Moorena TaxID=2683338 RepID=UPI001400E976|nr:MULTISPECIES: hypothetical protein [unclassified Moorena]NEO16874.1 hypothetical protein [Moorena sp. SIO3E8]NEQ00583.1 hypothetical protein [Moorena sp. SIO3F7]
MLLDQLSAISYQLSVISYQLSAISYQLSAISLCATRTLREQPSAYALRARYANSYQLSADH